MVLMTTAQNNNFKLDSDSDNVSKSGPGAAADVVFCLLEIFLCCANVFSSNNRNNYLSCYDFITILFL